MSAIDGLTNSWDIKNRLIRVESTNMVAQYAYDYLDRRITKTVHWKNPGPEEGTQVSVLNQAWRTTTTHYINRYFEVRDHDALVKYIWNGETRVARVTAQLGANLRIQHLRLQAGWNLVCLSVGGNFPVIDPANNSDVGACAYWSGSGSDNGYIRITGSTPVPPGANLWIYARRDTTVILVGLAAPQMLPSLSGTSQFFGNFLAEPISIAAVFPVDTWLAQFDTVANRWRHRFPNTDGLAALNDQSALLLPGKGSWLKAGASSVVTNQAALQVRYYHQDHLGSSSVITDGNGTLVEETADYPFGHTRHSYRPGPVSPEPYGFTQKEQDAESSLHYFEARYLASGLSRFASVDSKYANPSSLTSEELAAFISNPQELNLYVYCKNNPVFFTDPSGLSPEGAIVRGSLGVIGITAGLFVAATVGTPAAVVALCAYAVAGITIGEGITEIMNRQRERAQIAKETLGLPPPSDSPEETSTRSSSVAHDDPLPPPSGSSGSTSSSDNKSSASGQTSKSEPAKTK